MENQTTTNIQEGKENGRRKWIRLLSCLLFLALMVTLFSRITYLFRGYDRNKEGIAYFQYEDPFDMVMVGGSSTFVFWQPLQAWKEQGFTSYDYAANAMPAESIRFVLQEMEKTHAPDLVVIDIRPIQLWEPEFSAANLRYTADSMNLFSPNRLRMIREHLNEKTQGMDIDREFYYLDLGKYHDKLDSLAQPEAWKALNHEMRSARKGWSWGDVHLCLEQPGEEILNLTEAELPQDLEKSVVELLEYCAGLKSDVLFVATPSEITREEQLRINRMKELTEAYGFPLLDCNQHYEEIGLDFLRDFYDKKHVNFPGSQKFTRYLGQYIRDHYDLPDHSRDPAYNSWNVEYEKLQKEAGKWEDEHRSTISGRAETVERLEALPSIQSAEQWCSQASGGGTTLLMGCIGEMLRPEDQNQIQLLERLQVPFGKESAVRVISKGKVLYDGEEPSFQGEAGRIYPVSYQAAIEDGLPSIQVEGREYCGKERGTRIVVISNESRKVVDSVLLTTEDGILQLHR